jgi:serine/threonine-protein kinase RsbW
LPAAPKVHRLDLGGDLAEIAHAASWVASLAPDERLPACLLHDVQLCLEEALANIMTHGLAGIAEPRIRLSLSQEPGRLLLAVEDNGAPFDPANVAVPPPPRSLDEARPGGIGIPLMREFSDEIGYVRAGDRNCLSLVFDTARRSGDRAAVTPGGSSAPGR